jgi:hypothetical protein
MKQLEITDEQIKKAFEGKRFLLIEGQVYLQRLYIAQSIFKKVCDYGTGCAAHAYLLAKAEQEVNLARLNLERAKGKLGNIKWMKKP